MSTLKFTPSPRLNKATLNSRIGAHVLGWGMNEVYEFVVGNAPMAWASVRFASHRGGVYCSVCVSRGPGLPALDSRAFSRSYGACDKATALKLAIGQLGTLRTEHGLKHPITGTSAERICEAVSPVLQHFARVLGDVVSM